MKFFTSLTIALFISLTVFGQDGALDSSFAETGILMVDFVEGTETGNGVVVQEDGKILVIASARVENGFDIEIVRFNENGTVDTTFATDGVFRYQNDAGSDLGYDLKLLEDGSILACGSYAHEPADTDLFLFKLTPNGELDTTFGTDGIVIQTGDAGNDYARCLAVDDNGDIYLGGDVGIVGFGFARNVIAKFDANGMIDTTFGQQGIFMWNTDSTHNEILQIEILEDGHLLTSGRAKPAGSDRISLYKILNDGSGLDTSFGTDGAILAPFEGKGYGLTIHENGNILVTGNNLTGQGFNLVVLAYNQDGTANTEFGDNGAASFDYGINDVGLDILVQPDGKIIASGESGGTFFSGPPRAFFSVRMDAMGLIDTTWGEQGYVATPTSTLFAFSNASVMQPDGKILLVGASATVTTGNDLTIIRYGNFIDEDMDGFSIADDCDDTVAAINPEAEEIANNDIDENCDGELLIIDEDMDGYNSDEDCDDSNADINPEAEEIPNNEIDEDCDGVALIIDEDMDGYNSDEDCDDTNADINPEAEEIPNNGIDEDCDGMDLIVGVNETELSTRFDLYPNPATDRVTLAYEAQGPQPERAILYDVAGRQLRTYQLNFNAGKVAIDLDGITNGILILSIQTQEGIAVKRLVKE